MIEWKANCQFCGALSSGRYIKPDAVALAMGLPISYSENEPGLNRCDNCGSLYCIPCAEKNNGSCPKCNGRKGTHIAYCLARGIDLKSPAAEEGGESKPPSASPSGVADVDRVRKAFDDKPVIPLGSEKDIKRYIYVVVCEATKESNPDDRLKILKHSYDDRTFDEYDLSTLKKYSVGIPAVLAGEQLKKNREKLLLLFLINIGVWLGGGLFVSFFVWAFGCRGEYNVSRLASSFRMVFSSYWWLVISLGIAFFLDFITRADARVKANMDIVLKESKKWDKDHEHLRSDLGRLDWHVFSAFEWNWLIQRFALTRSRDILFSNRQIPGKCKVESDANGKVQSIEAPEERWIEKGNGELESALDYIEHHPDDTEAVDSRIEIIKVQGASGACAKIASDRLRAMIVSSDNHNLQNAALECLSHLSTCSQAAKAAFEDIKASGIVAKIVDRAKWSTSCKNALIVLFKANYGSKFATDAAALIVTHVNYYPDLIPDVRMRLGQSIRSGRPDDASMNALMTLLSMQDKPEFVSLFEELSREGKIAPLIELEQRRAKK